MSFISNPPLYERLQSHIHLPALPLIIGQEYIVYAYGWWDETLMYYICEEKSDEYPKPFPSEFFTVTDSQPSDLWIQHTDGNRRMVAAPEWNSLYYERLIDEDSDAVAAFVQMRERIDAEHKPKHHP